MARRRTGKPLGPSRCEVCGQFYAFGTFASHRRSMAHRTATNAYHVERRTTLARRARRVRRQGWLR